MLRNQFYTPTFFDLYGDSATFKADATTFVNTLLTEEELEDLYMLIASRYGDSNIRYTNDYLFKMNLFQHVKVYYPKVLAFVRDQKRLREASNAELQKGGKSITNVGAHNTANISTDTDEGINQLDSQQITNQMRGEFGVLLDRIEAYKAGEEYKFLGGLNKLFVQIIAPFADLLYGTETQVEEE